MTPQLFRRGRTLVLRPAAGGGTFTDTFSSASNPIASPWVSPNVANFTNMQTTGGIACGTVASDVGYPDAYAFHSGFTGNYRITGTIARSPSLNTSFNHEAELHICMAQDGTNVQSVEWYMNFGGQGGVMQWSGINDGSGSFFSVIQQPADAPGSISSGDMMRVTKNGTVGTFEYSNTGGASWSTIATVATLPFSTGCPGIGGFYRAGATPSHYGFEEILIEAL